MEELKHNLLGGKFLNPGLYLKYGSNCFYFDLGEGEFTKKDINKTKGVFISHAHLDHVFGFEKILGLRIGNPNDLIVGGPKNFTNQFISRLNSYTWNLLVEDNSLHFEINEFLDSKKKVRRYDIPEKKNYETKEFNGNNLLSTDEYSLDYIVLDHLTPSCAYCFKEKDNININKEKLNSSSFSEGVWIRDLKKAYNNKEESFDYFGKVAKVSDFDFLIDKTKGQKIVYATDFGFSKDNFDKVVSFAKDADHLYCESRFLEKDEEQARKTYHLTAPQVAIIANKANVKCLHLFHHSYKYQDGDMFIEEAKKYFKGDIK
jgi:ribonuclease Z